MSATSQLHGSGAKWRSESVLDIYNLSFAVFLFLSPWLFTYARGIARTDIWISSAAVAATAIAAIIAYANWKQWLNVLLGVWLMVSPWVLGFAHTRAMHDSLAIGLAVAFMAVIELFVVNYPDREDDRPS